MIKEETDTTRECSSILRTTTKEHKVSDCISEAFTSSV